MHPTLQDATNGLVRQMLFIGPKNVLQCYTHYLKDVSIFLEIVLSSVVHCDSSKILSGVLKKALYSQWFGWKVYFYIYIR